MTEKEKGCVYFFRHVGLTPVKIGYSTNESPLDRFEQFKTYAPYGAELIGFIRTYEPLQLETVLHAKYALKRLKGEWFKITNTDVEREIKLFSNLSDIEEMNDFQIEWSKKIEKKKNPYLELGDKSAREIIIDEFLVNKDFNKAELASNLNISRQYVHKVINEYNQ